MKRLVNVVIGIAILSFSPGIFAQGIAGSAHDFSSQDWNSSGEVCIVCHTPHNATTDVSNVPLWNHDVTSATFDLYSSSTLDGTTGQPDGTTKLCLSCHDGTVAMDNFGGTTGGTELMTGDVLVGTDLRDDHPVSISYNTVEDAELHDVTDPIDGGGTVDDLLFSNNVECASCHDVHNTGGHASLLRISNEGSALCLSCHIK